MTKQPTRRVAETHELKADLYEAIVAIHNKRPKGNLEKALSMTLVGLAFHRRMNLEKLARLLG
jgi:hypothetical protein